MCILEIVSTMASSSRQKKKNQEKHNNSQGVLENWFARDEEAIIAYIHEMSRKQINTPKVLEFTWLKLEKITETKYALKHKKLKQRDTGWEESCVICERY